MKFLFFIILALATIPLTITSAQTGNNEATIELEPPFPEPESTFTASLDDYSLTTQVTSITWKVNNVAVPDAKNERSITAKAGVSGQKMQIEALITLVSGGTRSIKKVITPLYLDIIIEPQTKTPAFYRGRSLPSVGSALNLTALLAGHNTPSSNLLYTWRINNTVVEGGSVRGKNRVSIITPSGQSFLISLDISTLDGSSLIKRTLLIPSVSPALHFYENSSLYGLNNQVLTTLNLIGGSATVRAEPYHLDIKTYNNPDHLEWKVDGSKTNASSNNPYEITVARPADGYSGRSTVNLHVRSLTQLLQGAKGEFQINF